MHVFYFVGPQQKVRYFVDQLRSEEIFAKEVNSAGVAFHSYYMQDIAHALKIALDDVIKTPKRRSSRWISSSIAENKWSSELAQFSSADYYVNNLVSPVLFQEALAHVPDDAITVEVAPHALLQSVLKRSLSPQCVFTSTMKRNHDNNETYLLENLGK